MRRVFALAGLLTIGLLAPIVSGQPQQGGRRIALETLAPGGNLYVLSGGGGNSAALVTDVGVVLVDTNLAGWGPSILEALQSVTDQPVVTIINTHSHADHTGGNGELPTAVEIVAHGSTQANMARDRPSGAAGRFLPTRTFGDRLSLTYGRDRVELYHLGAAHTNGDAIVVFPDARAAHVGDLFADRSVPRVDRSSGGSAVAYPKTLARAVAEITGVATIINGHAVPPLDPARSEARARPVRAWMTWTDLREYADFNRDFLAAVETAIKDGKGVDAAAAGLTLSNKYPGYNMDRAREHVAAIYEELGR